MVVGSAITGLSDDSESLTARVSVAAYRTGDLISFATDADGVSVENLGGGVYSLMAASVQQLLTVLQSTRFSSSSEDPTADGAATRQVNFELSDGVNTSTQSLTVTIGAVNNAPVLDIALGASVQTGRTLTLASTMLHASDPDDASSDIAYELTQLSASGRLQLAGADLAVGDLVTQADIDAGRVTFIAAKTGQQTFVFTLRDGGEDAAVVTPDISLTFSVMAPPAGSASSTGVVDGVEVQTGTVINADGSVTSVVTVPIIADDRVDDSGEAAVADIPLVIASGGISLLTALVPAGIGLQASGVAVPGNPSGALDSLIQQIMAHTTASESAQQSMILGASSFIEGLSGTASILLQTVTVTGDMVNQSGGLLTLNGSPSAVDALATALVIDGGGLPAGGSIVLNNVSFAAIAGSVTVVAGEGGQTIFTDDSSQTVTVGAGDQIFAGGGSDLLQLSGVGRGNALLHGGSGSDSATFRGSIADYLLSYEAASVTIKPLDASGETVTLVNVETLNFSDAQINVPTDASVEWLAGLYQQVLDRQADMGGVEFWAGLLANGAKRADVMLAMLTSSEVGAVLDVSTPQGESETLDLLYQSLLGREADAEGKVFWQDALGKGESLSDVVEAFGGSVEMQGQVLAADQWSFMI